MTIYEITAIEERIFCHITVIMRRHLDSTARREALSALLDRLDSLEKLKNLGRE